MKPIPSVVARGLHLGPAKAHEMAALVGETLDREVRPIRLKLRQNIDKIRSPGGLVHCVSEV
jgi:hypothetical protein